MNVPSVEQGTMSGVLSALFCIILATKTVDYLYLKDKAKHRFSNLREVTEV